MEGSCHVEAGCHVLRCHGDALLWVRDVTPSLVQVQLVPVLEHNLPSRDFIIMGQKYEIFTEGGKNLKHKIRLRNGSKKVERPAPYLEVWFGCVVHVVRTSRVAVYRYLGCTGLERFNAVSQFGVPTVPPGGSRGYWRGRNAVVKSVYQVQNVEVGFLKLINEIIN